ncbi:SMP-30/gluconolactonase/LRE family protein [Stackebrandtia nassauensis]|uniref:SMP-30/Gluconolaconase/LRE domain protein n=1 Tax=Stackebrandtia nassauensis (strain DSM 44728 / CIP 108903 / NRRL B-16338 / NBRC 102104 / LLR-40K-21) TaxID=446470 RepID=D3Q1U7_STANL|nr:SMP-30/gluconolactonase/LRE family protein [Stackebrandtia nassauensis]ADD39945.1 SMP-30/Gluconolaconase/LRE domain protein [Stackebrandtia nassauensis DSM 44728]
MDEPKVVLSDLVVGESPRWHEGRLWFCNWGAHEIIAVDPDGNAEVVLRDAEVDPHSIDWLPDGRMLIVPKNTERGRLLRREPNGDIVSHADLSGLPSGFNEIVVDGRGNVYVNGADFDFLSFISTLDHTDQRPLHLRPGFVPGFIALITPDGRSRIVAEDIAFPNGMLVTPDNATLIISESFAGRLSAFDVAADGGLSGRRVWAEGLGPDGICRDADGAVWTSSGETDCVRVAEGGEILDRVDFDRSPFACMLGGPERRTLYVVAATWNPENPFGGRTGQLLAVPAPAAGVGWP